MGVLLLSGLSGVILRVHGPLCQPGPQGGVTDIETEMKMDIFLPVDLKVGSSHVLGVLRGLCVGVTAWYSDASSLVHCLQLAGSRALWSPLCSASPLGFHKWHKGRGFIKSHQPMRSLLCPSPGAAAGPHSPPLSLC